MVQVTTDGDDLVLDVQGLHKIWALRSRLRIPLRSIQSVKADPELARRPRGVRAPGTFVPGLITAGTFYYGGKRIFWDVCKPANAIVIDASEGTYAQFIIEVAEPEAVIHQIEAAIGKGSARSGKSDSNKSQDK